MTSTHFYILFVGYVSVLLILQCKYVRSKQQPKSKNGKDFKNVETTDCDKVFKEEHVQNFYMRMGLCRKNMTVVCETKPIHPCFKNVTNLKVTAFIQGQRGQCLIEANVTKSRTLQFYMEAKRIKNPNQEGSRSLAETERHQKGKCGLKYYCHKRALIYIRMDCGTVFLSQGQSQNYTKHSRVWKAPRDFKDFAVFAANIVAAKDKREVDITSVRIFGSSSTEDEEKLDPDPSKPINPILNSGTDVIANLG